ncbi:MAG TPA: FAD-dependent monooxygenase [Propionibacteriaceae bacterium]|nr:FAD-dependent monooxygenase [Propionibacteriaceae bacterium]
MPKAHEQVSRRSGPRILVVGAGIAGLATARSLRGHGFSVEVVERQRTWPQAGAGIYLPGNAARALRSLGLAAAVTERAALISRQRFSDHRGRLLFEVDVAGLWHGVGPCLALHRADLHTVLATHGGPVEVSLGRAVREIDQHGGTATAEFDDGSLGRFDLIIGADGIHSTVRERCFDGTGAQPVGRVAWRFVTGCPADLTAWTVMFGRDVTFLTIPIGGGLAYCYVDSPAQTGTEPVEQLRPMLAGFAEPVPSLLAALGPDGPVHVGVVEEVSLAEWVSGAVLLVGDAAHATAPNMAQGAAMAFEDALVLAECLTTTSDLGRAIADFQRRRRPRTEWVRQQTQRRDRMRGLVPPLRDRLMRVGGPRIFRANYRPLLDPP